MHGNIKRITFLLFVHILKWWLLKMSSLKKSFNPHDYLHTKQKREMERTRRIDVGAVLAQNVSEKIMSKCRYTLCRTVKVHTVSLSPLSSYTFYLERKTPKNPKEWMPSFYLFKHWELNKHAHKLKLTQTHSQTNNFKTSKWQMECVFSQSFKLKTNENTRLFTPCCFFIVISVSHLSSFFNAKNWTIPLEYHCLHSC